MPPVGAAEDKAVSALVERLASAQPSERAEAACELGRRGRAAAPGPVECGMSPWLRRQLEARPQDWRKFETTPGREAAEALSRIGEPAVGPLLAALASGVPAARANAAFALGEIDPRERRAEVLARLMQALKDEEPSVRRECAKALGEIGDAEAVPGLLAAVRDKAAPVRASAAWALGEIGDKRAVEPLVRTLWDEDAEVRSQAAWGLGELGDGRAVEGLMGAVDDADRRVRRQVAWALGEIGDPTPRCASRRPGPWARSGTAAPWRGCWRRFATARFAFAARPRGPWARSPTRRPRARSPTRSRTRAPRCASRRPGRSASCGVPSSRIEERRCGIPRS
jgi:HEAT repeat protein